MSLRHAILGFLSFQPFTGYDLKKAFDRSVRHFWPATQSQIYRTLAELDADGLIEKEVVAREDRLDKKIYAITGAGREELRRWLAKPLPIQETREPLLIQVFFAGLLSDAELLPVLEHHIREIEEQLRMFSALYEASRARISSPVPERTIFLSLLTVEYALGSLSQALHWLQAAATRVRAGDYALTPVTELLGPNAIILKESA